MKKYGLIFLLLINSVCLFAQVITGKVIDAENNQPISGASVYLNGTQKGTTSNTDGVFDISSTEKNIPLN
jgi:hypothetical protein